MTEYRRFSFISQNTDEWKDFQEEEKKDYSGLKIQNLQINDDDGEKQNSKQNESEEETEVNEQGETVVKKKCGPWRVIQEQKKEEVKPPPGNFTFSYYFKARFRVSRINCDYFIVVVEEKKPPKEEEPSDRYVPPSRRVQGFSTNVKKPTTSESSFKVSGSFLAKCANLISFAAKPSDLSSAELFPALNTTVPK